MAVANFTVNLTFGDNFAINQRVATTLAFVTNITAQIPAGGPVNNGAQVAAVAFAPNQQNPNSVAITIQYHSMALHLKDLQTNVFNAADATTWPGDKGITFA